MTPIAVAVVSFNTREHLRVCLRSARADGAAELVVADNGSLDGSAEMVRWEFPEARLLVDPSNPGYGAAANRAIAATTTPYALLLNADTRLDPGALRSLVAYLDAHPEVAIAGPRLTGADGALQPSCRPFLGTIQLAFEKTPLGPLLARLPMVGDRLLLHHWRHDRPRAVPWVLGAALAIRRLAFDAVGGFDPAFFLYAEEVDLCYRLAAAGWETHFTPAATVLHEGGASTGACRPEMEACRVASARLFYRRHYSRPRAAALSALIACAMLARLGRDRLRLAVTRNARGRARLVEDIAVWRRAVRG